MQGQLLADVLPVYIRPLTSVLSGQLPENEVAIIIIIISLVRVSDGTIHKLGLIENIC